MSEEYNQDAEIITNAEVFYLYALLVTYRDGYRCVFDISDSVSKYIIDQPFRDDPLFIYDFVVNKEGYKIEWNIDYASDNIREVSVSVDDILQYIKEQSICRKNIIARNKSDPFAKEKERNRIKTHKETPFEADLLGKRLKKSILRIIPLAPYVLRLTYKDGYKCIFDLAKYILDHQELQFSADVSSGLSLDSCGTNMIYGNIEISAEEIRELSIPMNDIIQWIGEESRRIREEIQNKY